MPTASKKQNKKPDHLTARTFKPLAKTKTPMYHPDIVRATKLVQGFKSSSKKPKFR